MLPGWNHTRLTDFSHSPLVINPGGPGVGGVDFILWAGKHMQQAVGPAQDIVSFDPRGVGFTKPTADCWSTADKHDAIWKGFVHRSAWAVWREGLDLPDLDQNWKTIRVADAYDRAITSLCGEKHEQQGVRRSIFPYMGTEYTARDLLHIVDAWEAWRFGGGPPTGEGASSENNPERADESPNSTRGKLIFWGFSYGSFLGATFAASYPDRVGRLILDGVVNAQENGDPFWQSSLRDTDKVLQEFFRGCCEADTKCADYRPGDQVFDIKRRYESALATAEGDPLWCIDASLHEPKVLGLATLKRRIFASLYLPVSSFAGLAELLDSVYTRNAIRLAAFVGGGPRCPDSCQSWLPPEFLPNDAGIACQCADKDRPMNQTIPQIRSALETMLGKSQFGDVWMGINLRCNGWSIKPKPGSETSGRPFWSNEERGAEMTIKRATSSPLLFIGNSLDPVTPLADAIAMAHQFKGASLLELRAPGHTSLAATSLCVIQTVREYLRSGAVLPLPRHLAGQSGIENGEGALSRISCEPDERPWGNDEALGRRKALTEEDAGAMEAWSRLQVAVSGYFPTVRDASPLGWRASPGDADGDEQTVKQL